MDFSVVIPTFNRFHNLKLALVGLNAQKDPPSFEVIIADDGSTDGTHEYFEGLNALWGPEGRTTGQYSFPVKYVYCGPNLGFRTARTRNIGVAQAAGRWAILLDSDVVLNPDALREHARVRAAHPDVVLVGMYHFAQRADHLLPHDVAADFGSVMSLVPQTVATPPVSGLDFRYHACHDTFEADKIITQYDGLAFISGNLSWPIDLWWKMGGQNERMPSGQGEDAELGQRMRLGYPLIGLLRGGADIEEAVKAFYELKLEPDPIPVLMYAPIYGVHMYHHRDAAVAQRLVNMSIKYIDRLHGVGTYAARTHKDTDPRDMRLSMWYVRRDGAMLVKLDDGPTVFAVDATQEYYVGIPSPGWVDLLDFTPTDVAIVEQGFFDGKQNMGTIVK